MVRVLSQPAYPTGQRSPAEAIAILRALKEAFPDTYESWPDSISLEDATFFHSHLPWGVRQVSDASLAGLALHRAGVFVSFDRCIAWRAEKGASQELVERPYGTAKLRG